MQSESLMESIVFFAVRWIPHGATACTQAETVPAS